MNEHPSVIRERALAEGLRAFAKKYGHTLKGHLHIDTLGEFRIVVEPGPEHPHKDFPNACGDYGEDMAAVLTKYDTRTGGIEYGYKRMRHATDGWCMMNHFEVERMLTDEGFYTPPQPAVSPREDRVHPPQDMAHPGGFINRNDEP